MEDTIKESLLEVTKRFQDKLEDLAGRKGANYFVNSRDLIWAISEVHKDIEKATPPYEWIYPKDYEELEVYCRLGCIIQVYTYDNEQWSRYVQGSEKMKITSGNFFFKNNYVRVRKDNTPKRSRQEILASNGK